MDRLQYRFEPCHQAPPRPTFQLASDLVTPPLADSSRALFAPLHYESSYAYPLIVWLHGPGNDERQLMRVMPQVSMRNYLAVAPRGEPLTPRDAADRKGYTWSQSSDGIPRAEARVFDCIEAAARKYHVAPRRVFLVGFDVGGTMAFRIAMNHPQRFAGVVSLGGQFPRGSTPLGNLSLARKLPVLLATGHLSDGYPAEKVCDDLRLFHTAGLSTTLRQYPGGQELSPQMLLDVDRWIMEQIASPGSSTQSSDVRWLHEV
jgi:phospholipase/carboxylesterase